MALGESGTFYSSDDAAVLRWLGFPVRAEDVVDWLLQRGGPRCGCMDLAVWVCGGGRASALVGACAGSGRWGCRLGCRRAARVR